MKKEFKKGDLVKLKEGLIIGHKYGSSHKFTFLRSMNFNGCKEIEDNPTENSCKIGMFYYPLTILKK